MMCGNCDFVIIFQLPFWLIYLWRFLIKHRPNQPLTLSVDELIRSVGEETDYQDD